MQSFEKLEKVPNMIQLIMGIVVATITMDLRDFDAMKRTMDDTGPIDLLLLNHNVFVLLLPDINLMETLCVVSSQKIRCMHIGNWIFITKV